MLNVSEATKTAYAGSSVPKALKISFPDRNIIYTNEDIISESFSLQEVLENDSNLTFKGCIASQCKFKVVGLVTDLRGEWVEVTIQAGDPEEIDEIPLFAGYVDSQDNETHTDISTELTCYDPLYSIGSRNMQTWVSSLNFPMTVKQLRDALFTEIGITQESKTLINDSLSISGNFKTFCDEPSAVDIMRWICEVNAVSGQYGRDQKFHYREFLPITEGLYPSDTTYPSEETYPAAENVGTIIDTSQYINVKYQPYATEMISKVTIYDSGGLDVAYAGSGTNVLGISDNPIAFNVPMQQAVNAIYAKVASISYIPMIQMELTGLPYLECGDTYMCYTRRNAVRSYILKRTLKGIQSLRDSYQSDSDKEYPPHKATSTSRSNADKQAILEIQADIVQMNNTIIQNAQIAHAEVQDLAAISITTRNFSSQQINANQITAGVLNVDRIQAGSIQAQKLNVSASDGNGWGVSFGSGGSSFSKGSYAATGLTGSVGGSRGWGVNFGGYGESGSMSVGTLDASSITTGTLSADRIAANSINASKINLNSLSGYSLSVQDISCRSLSCRSFMFNGQYYTRQYKKLGDGQSYWILIGS